MDLPVHYEDRQVATIRADAQATRLAYADAWRSSADSFPISLAMPIRPEPYEGEQVLPWLMNLLPEGEPLRAMTRALGAAPEDALGLIAQTGNDLAGALSIAPQQPRGEPGYRPIPDAGALERIIEELPSLAERIPRNIKSIERKHQNISAIMIGFRQPWVTGLKPAKHYQNALADGVLRWLDQRPDWLEPRVQADEDGHVREVSSLWIGPPPTHQNEPPLIDPTIMAAIGKKYDVAERDARNRRLGKAGEELILHHERQSLLQAGRDDLAHKVRWTAVQDGDGYGFDIASFEPDGRERLIEVKTTNGWERTPFHISQNEIAVAESRRDEWHLVRVWNFARQPKAFSLRPPLSAHIELTPTSFLAALR